MFEAIITLIIMTMLLLGSPGPAPLSLAFVSSNFGLKKGLNYLFGILTGLFFVTLATGFGLHELLKIYPKITFILSFFAFIWMSYIAYKIAFSGSNLVSGTAPPNFRDGFILNLSNPKAYAALFSIFSGFTLPFENKLFAVFFTGLICFIVGVILDLLWVLAGASLSGFLQNKKYDQIVRQTCGLSLMVIILYSALRARF